MLSEQKMLRQGIERVVDELNLCNGPTKVLGVYLFGSVLNLKAKAEYKRPPRDIDLYVWVSNNSDTDSDTVLLRMIQKEMENNCRIYNLEVDCSVFSHHPFNHREYTGGIAITEVYPLYLHPDRTVLTEKMLAESRELGLNI